MRFVSKEICADKKFIEHISKKYDIHETVATILISRGFTDTLDEFFSEGEIHNPYLLKDMDKVVDCIKKHIEKGNKITIYGDYDVDGVCACSILYLYLKSISANVHVFLPNRHKDGYGLNRECIDAIAEDGTNLIITVDCGISNTDEVAYAISKGMEVIVTDHHQCPEKLPKCVGVVNPLLGDYPYKLLCGSGVALKVVQALGGQEEFDRYVDLAAVATVADLVLLTGENRAIVKRGLSNINGENRRTGISAICAKAGIEKDISSGRIAFAIGPRINAAGRMDSARKAFDLLVCDDYEKAVILAEALNAANNKRKSLETDILNQAIMQIENQDNMKFNKVITVCGKEWNKGVIGIVASKLVERYCRPVIVFSEENSVCVGSGRGIHGIHLFKLINNFGESFIKYGGHEMAAGMSVEEGKLKELNIKLNDYAAKNFDESLFIPTMAYDIDIDIENITSKLVNDIQMLAPLGMGNKTPVFRLRGVELKNPRLIGENKNHIKMNAVRGAVSIDAVAFSMGDRINDIKAECKYDVLATLEVNSWENRNYLQLQIKEFKLSLKSGAQNFVSKNGKSFFRCLKSAAELPICNLDKKRIRQMWNWEIYLTRRLNKDVLGTAVYSSIPSCSYELVNFLNEKQLGDNVDVCTAKPCGNSCVVIAPDWEVDELNYSRLVIFDYAPTDFIGRVLRKNPDIQIVICNNDFTENCLQRFLMGLDFERDKAKIYYSIINSICKIPTEQEELVSRFCAMGNETSFNGYFALNVFCELGFLQNKEGKIYTLKTDGKKDLSGSSVIRDIYSLKEKIFKEIDLIKPPRNYKGKIK